LRGCFIDELIAAAMIDIARCKGVQTPTEVLCMRL
jgi:hypothetical protein